MPEIPQILTLFLPALTIPLSGWISHNRLSLWQNGILVMLITLLSAFLWALLVPPLVPPPYFWGEVIGIATYCLVLGYGPLLPLYLWLWQALPSPLALFLKSVPEIITMQGRTSSAVGTVNPIAQRTSLLSAGQQWARQQEVSKPVPPPEQTPPS